MDIEEVTLPEPIVLPRSEHHLSRKLIDNEAIKVLYRLHRNGFKAFLVGGGVRDLLLGRKPKDFDVGTDATPNQVRKLFRNCFLVGRRFRLAHIRFGPDQLVEVATFRRQADLSELPECPKERAVTSENVFGTPAEDASRRDFTINALFYDISDFSIVDYVGGLRDLEEKKIRVIGDPMVRFEEDPVRMLRALEFAARLNFELDAKARDAIGKLAHKLAGAAPARLREELMELFRHKVAGPVLRQAKETGLLEHLFPDYSADANTLKLIERIDQRTASGKPVTEAIVLASLYLSSFLQQLDQQPDLDFAAAMHLANELLEPHRAHYHIAHGIRHQAREMMLGIYRFKLGRGRRGEKRFLRHPATPAAFELFRLWHEVSGEDQDLVATWQEILAGRENEPAKKQSQRSRPGGGQRRRRPRRRPTGKSPAKV
jgi:poly(A) polymerase